MTKLTLTLDGPRVIAVKLNGKTAEFESLAQTKAGEVIETSGYHLVINHIALAVEHFSMENGQ